MKDGIGSKCENGVQTCALPIWDPAHGDHRARRRPGLNLMSDCLFCKIANGEIPSDVVYEDDDVVAFNDINPQAPTHVLVIPRRHIRTTHYLTPDDRPDEPPAATQSRSRWSLQP